ncbi:MAG TPA: MarR family transcriptional regulator [Steroidobacteraceae bacterium]|nr:MarR family transcriptional regulator [Steroidobacteraceae bacterium]
MKQTKTLRKADYETLAAFRYVLRRFIHFSEEAAKTVNITPQQHQALLAIKGFPGRDRVTIGELAERLQLRHHSVVGLVDRLARDKLVVRAPGKDRREVLVQLTDRGEQILADLSYIHRTELRQISPKLKLLLQELDHGHEQ